MQEIRLRVVIIGNSSVGKTSILNQLIDHSFNPNTNATVGANYQVLVSEVDGRRFEMQIWDTAGQEKFQALGPLYYRDSDAAVVVYDQTNRASFENAEKWVSAFKDTAGSLATIALVSNKADLIDQTEVSFDEGKSTADSKGYLFFQTSALDGNGIAELFEDLARHLLTSSYIFKTRIARGVDTTGRSNERKKDKSGCC